MISKIVIFFWVIGLPLLVFGQNTISVCNSFEGNTNHVFIDTAGTWDIGSPSKIVFDTSYNSANSIVTHLDSFYSANDTSSFYVSYKDAAGGGLPNYIGVYAPLEIEFKHRFLTDSITDYGLVEMSVDDGITWYDVLSSDYNINWCPDGQCNMHYFEESGDTMLNSLEVYGNSNGWVHSKVSKDIRSIIWNTLTYPDSLILKFTFVTDSIGGNEGWQIDDLCISMDMISGINQVHNFNNLTIYPNPNNGEFFIVDNKKASEVIIYDYLGKEVYSDISTKSVVSSSLTSGIYLVILKQAEVTYATKMVVE